MNYAITLLEQEKKKIGREIRNDNLMQQDMKKARAEMSKINELKRAIKILKQKNKNL
jgi:hypothetical protein